MELTDRKKRILKVVVEDYIETAEPVASKTIAAQMGGGVSSATIRNELADLVELGYLEQPHTSAGRIPSPKGYRLYVNELMERRSLSEQEAEDINAALRGRMEELDSVISRAGQVVSSLAGYPAYAVSSGKKHATLRRFELLGVSDVSFICVMMTDASHVKSQILTTEIPFDEDCLPQLTNLLNTHFTSRTITEMNERLMSVSEQLPAPSFLALSKVITLASEVLSEAERPDVFTTGTNRILKMPEFRDADRAHELMTFMVESKESLPAPDDGAPMKILIGPENVNEALRDTSVVVASYDIGDNMRGLVGVVGPTRMDYAAVTARLSYFAESLSNMFGKNQLPPAPADESTTKKQGDNP